MMTQRRIVIPGDKEETLRFCINQWIEIANASVRDRGRFTVALSGGSTPKAIFKGLCTPENAVRIPWEKIFLFWSDERSAPPDSEESNYHMAMEAGFYHMPFQPKHIFRMKAEKEIEAGAVQYESLIKSNLIDHQFDLIMLGMGDDGHTASLFPHTEGLKENKRLVIANYIPQKSTWRMTFTFTALHQTRHLLVYVLGKEKAPMVAKVLSSPYDPEELPSQRLGTPACPAEWILDQGAASLLR